MIQIRLDLQKITWPLREPPRPIFTFLHLDVTPAINLSEHSHKLRCRIFHLLVEVLRAVELFLKY